jgi:hypothetical protein
MTCHEKEGQARKVIRKRRRPREREREKERVLKK